MKPIKTALCSYGMSGFVFHAPFIALHSGFELYAICERSKNEAAKRYPSALIYRSVEELINDDSIELVVVNTPSVTHYEYTKKALLAGKHVIVEKPFTATTEEAQDLIGLASDNNLKLSVYHNRRYDSDFLTVKKIIEKGLLGNMIDAEIRYDRYDPILSYKTHKETPTSAVGSLYDLGSHLIDQSLYLFGMPDALFLDSDIIRPYSQVDDYYDLKLLYPTHRVSVKSSYYVREPSPAFAFHGTLGSFIKSRGDIQESQLKEGIIPSGSDWGVESSDHQGILHCEFNGQIERRHYPTEKGDYMKYYDGVYNALRNDANLPVTAQEGSNVIKIIEAAKQSHQQRKMIEL